jgi:hypothetical protein
VMRGALPLPYGPAMTAETARVHRLLSAFAVH